MLEKSKEGLSRRKFIGSCAVAAGTFAAGEAISTGSFTGNAQACTTENKLPLPYPRKGLKPKKVGELAFKNYDIGHCMYAGATGLLFSLRDALSHNKHSPRPRHNTPWFFPFGSSPINHNPYATIPADMFIYGKGGVMGWGTICGALNGAIAVIGLVANGRTCKEYTWGAIVNELIGWYALEEFPGTDFDDDSDFPGQPTTVSNSPLCHISASKWVKEAAVKMSSKERSGRCAKVSGQVAKKASELLNQFIVDSTFEPVYETSDEFKEFASCLGCHNSGFDPPAGYGEDVDNEKGKMNCNTCHIDDIGPRELNPDISPYHAPSLIDDH